MKKEKFKFIYGPVFSWRLGRSLGIDPLSQEEKICSFDCIYCQVGRAAPLSCARKEYVPASLILNEIKQLSPQIKIDYITFSGKGEPTLAKNLGDLIRGVKKIRKEPVAVITNASLIDNPRVRKDLCLADFVMAKLDAGSPDVFSAVNHPWSAIKLRKIVNGLAAFRREYKGRLGLQIMFVKKNIKEAAKIAGIAAEVCVDEIQINTPLRKSRCRPLSMAELNEIKKVFQGFVVVSVYEGRKKAVRPINARATLQRRGV
ncbi:MAG: radical SAM protein [Candidatus Omnitrophica bacterium]|nr:radical SAM protein [Candidatus Omnitrophota bacterium]MBU4478323.1 radical SAM protein [Candidatus Omnitrophota bacterium]MCG2704251.1 radical SAM protein [Candidatus Omnitrophota bacterium]